jgi:hypothetical protein
VAKMARSRVIECSTWYVSGIEMRDALRLALGLGLAYAPK